ncbi:hypothetical protein BZA05DRAFT_89833 [Tricharina praecox]|uniref:uncharacterized protein n=1 Tax=Tricharina praecox TaxID=43433 RepID=UPI00221FAD9A|nr:uncharacterized protein BZA05DRAFT_89833 [Tricharina praecox]KAI5848899.1 hypothetical protein BZA05DRAFT_89833 [Tricharina praecox]
MGWDGTREGVGFLLWACLTNHDGEWVDEWIEIHPELLCWKNGRMEGRKSLPLLPSTLLTHSRIEPQLNPTRVPTRRGGAAGRRGCEQLGGNAPEPSQLATPVPSRMIGSFSLLLACLHKAPPVSGGLGCACGYQSPYQPTNHNPPTYQQPLDLFLCEGGNGRLIDSSTHYPYSVRRGECSLRRRRLSFLAGPWIALDGFVPLPRI